MSYSSSGYTMIHKQLTLRKNIIHVDLTLLSHEPLKLESFFRPEEENRREILKDLKHKE